VSRLDTGLLTALAALQVGDIITTRYIIDQGGRELNPMMADAVEHPITFLGAKGLLVVVAGCMAEYGRKHDLTGIVRLVLAALIAYYGLVVGHNVYRIAGAV